MNLQHLCKKQKSKAVFISLVTFLVSDLEPLAVKGEATNIFLCSGLSKQFFSLLRLPCVILILI